MSKTDDKINISESLWKGSRRLYWFCGFCAGVCGSGSLPILIDKGWLMFSLLILAIIFLLYLPVWVTNYMIARKRKGK